MTKLVLSAIFALGLIVGTIYGLFTKDPYLLAFCGIFVVSTSLQAICGGLTEISKAIHTYVGFAKQVLEWQKMLVEQKQIPTSKPPFGEGWQ